MKKNLIYLASLGLLFTFSSCKISSPLSTAIKSQSNSSAQSTSVVPTNSGPKISDSTITDSSPIIIKSGKSYAEIEAIFMNADYTVNYQNYQGVFALVAQSNHSEDRLIVLAFPNQQMASSAKPFFDAIAASSSAICRQDENNLYFGSYDAIAIYENGQVELDKTGKSLQAVNNAFTNAGYVVEIRTYGQVMLYAFNYMTIDQIIVIFFDSDYLAIQAKPQYDAYANENGVECKRDGSNLYCATPAAIAIYESLLNIMPY